MASQTDSIIANLQFDLRKACGHPLPPWAYRRSAEWLECVRRLIKIGDARLMDYGVTFTTRHVDNMCSIAHLIYSNQPTEEEQAEAKATK